MSRTSENKQVAVALLSSEVSICENNRLVDFFKAVRLKKPNLSLHILFSKNTSDQDISTFKDNFKLDFEVTKMTSELNDYWEQTARKYETPGIVILSNQNNLFASQDLPKLKKAIEAY